MKKVLLIAAVMIVAVAGIYDSKEDLYYMFWKG